MMNAATRGPVEQLVSDLSPSALPFAQAFVVEANLDPQVERRILDLLQADVNGNERAIKGGLLHALAARAYSTAGNEWQTSVYAACRATLVASGQAAPAGEASAFMDRVRAAVAPAPLL